MSIKLTNKSSSSALVTLFIFRFLIALVKEMLTGEAFDFDLEPAVSLYNGVS